ncbi:MAG: Asp-tRNA(Asn)/Glu-tRNA(Gln) amidotransferase subunit GatA [Planctomycetota bacterium]|nr:Asp-tRNA(Asn)/Glu-tRNA(Gln) amidotransferase subunit GatA [Planctomycetota bacterium]
MSSIHTRATDWLKQLESGTCTSTEITQLYLDQIERHDGTIQAFLHVDHEAALKQARDIDKRRQAGKPVGRLGGLPVAVKDILCSLDQPTTCGSKQLEHFQPPYDATVVARLKQEDAVLIGRTNMDEFAMGSSTENSAFQLTRNPWDVERIPGGSSGGAAACVAAAMAPLSIGTDTGGSIRQPAALCGVSGMKPTYGRVSRYGLVAFASSLDQVGPLAGNAEDLALLMEVLAGHDPLDSTSAPVDVPSYTATVQQPLEGLRVGWIPEQFRSGLDPEIEAATQEALDVYRSLGASVQEVALPHARYGIATYYIIAPCEASGNLARYDGVHYGYRTDEQSMLAELREQRLAAATPTDVESPLVRMYRKTRSEGFGSEVKRRIMLGTYALSKGYYDAYYLKAQKVRRLIRDDYDQAFQKVDILLGPVTASPAFRIAEKTDDPLAMYLEDLYTVTANLAGIAGISIPCGFTSESLPIGLQLQASPFQEEKLLRASYMYQAATDWHSRRPDLT